MLNQSSKNSRHFKIIQFLVSINMNLYIAMYLHMYTEKMVLIHDIQPYEHMTGDKRIEGDIYTHSYIYYIWKVTLKKQPIAN